jgi:hypothetical protein
MWSKVCDMDESLRFIRLHSDRFAILKPLDKGHCGGTAEVHSMCYYAQRFVEDYAERQVGATSAAHFWCGTTEQPAAACCARVSVREAALCWFFA